MPSISIILPSLEQNKKKVTNYPYLVEKEPEKVVTCIAVYEQQLIYNYNKRVMNQQFQPRNIVVRKAFTFSVGNALK